MDPVLAKLNAELASRRAARGPDSLLDFVPRVTPDYKRPSHLEPLAKYIERSLTEPVRVCVSVAPRHGKSDLLLHSIAWKLARDPKRYCAFVSYADDFASEKCARAREIAKRAGVRLSKKQADYRWETLEGGGCMATGILGQLTGRGFTDIIVDDPIKNREEAESPTHRQKVYDGFQSDVSTRLDPRGTSIFVVMARWHTDDLIGRLVKDGWEYVNLPAISPDESVLWPEVWSLEFLRETERTKGPYVFSGLYQGNPIPRGNAMFGEPARGEAPPVAELDVAIGIDLAYSAKTRSDFSALCILGRDRRTGKLHVLESWHGRVDAPAFAEQLRARASVYPGAPIRWYIASTERGSADLMRVAGIPVVGIPARGDKMTRALSTAASWSAGRIVVPEHAPWVSEFLAETSVFTGTGGVDDQCDALVSAHDALVVPLSDRLLPSWDPAKHVTKVDLDKFIELCFVAAVPEAEPASVLVVGIDAAKGVVAVGAEYQALVPGVDALLETVLTAAFMHPRAKKLITNLPRQVASVLRARRQGRHFDIVGADRTDTGQAGIVLQDAMIRDGSYLVDVSCTLTARQHAEALRNPISETDIPAAMRRAIYPRLRRRVPDRTRSL